MSLYSRELGYDMFDDGEDTDSDIENSSDDDIDMILHGTPEQQRKLQHLHDKEVAQRSVVSRGLKALKNAALKQDSSSEDEFEKQMNAELDKNVKFIEDSRVKSRPSGSGSVSVKSTTNRKDKLKPEDKFYDEVYFDSDEEMDAEQRDEGEPKHAVISNDDLLYDPEMDNEDQKWVDKQRQSHRREVLGGGKTGKKKRKMPNSDALLDCPACMTTLCIDCQRHDSYKHQFRAMFVMNCEVDTTEHLQCPEEAPKKKKKKKKKGGGAPTSTTETPESTTQKQPPAAPTDLFNPVRCTECRTVVGVIDKEEIYHFFNVLASHT